VSKDDGATWEYQMYVNSGFLISLINTASGDKGVQSTFGTPGTGTWYFLILEYDSGTDALCISVNNGTPDSNAAFAHGGPQDGSSALTIGDTPGEFWDGRIDEVGIWNRVLTSGEKATLYNSGSGTTYPF
jgi:hypothetical protein